jgi:hypothetical protein
VVSPDKLFLIPLIDDAESVHFLLESLAFPELTGTEKVPTLVVDIKNTKYGHE